jgi:hypothetical protein
MFENKTILILDLILTFLLKLVVEKRKKVLQMAPGKTALRFFSA